MKKILAVLSFAFPALLSAQTDVTVTIDPSQASQIVRLAVPFPDSIPKTAGATVAASEEIRETFFAPLTRDLAYSDAFAIAPLPPGVAPTIDVAKRAGAHYLLKINVFREGPDYLIDPELFDMTGASVLKPQRYRSPRAALTRTAHTIANDILRIVRGTPGIFMTRIAFASNRTGNWEIWLMDWDGANQTQITNHGVISILPSWAPDNERMVYTSWLKGTSDMWIINRRGGGRIRLHTGLNLNTSATFSPVNNDIAFVGSTRGNPDIYLISAMAIRISPTKYTPTTTVHARP